jgi:hypothetical protein
MAGFLFFEKEDREERQHCGHGDIHNNSSEIRAVVISADFYVQSL